jgi:putative PIN family toxin of toxin-antitoxin system
VKVFLDTNVLVSAVISRGLCRDLLKTALEEHDVVVLQLVVEEFERVLRDKFGATQPALDNALMLLDDVEVTTNPTVALEAGALETNDTLILTAAIEARADVLVTGDHGMLEQEYDLPIDVVSPRGFMELTSQPDSCPIPTDRDDEPTVSDSSTDTTGERAFEFALSIVKLCRMLGEQSHDVIVGRLLRAGTGIGANIEEATAEASRRDFLRKMSAASKDARETNYWLRLLDQSKTAPEIDFAPYLENSSALVRLLTNILGTHVDRAGTSLLEQMDELRVRGRQPLTQKWLDHARKTGRP